MFSGNNKLAMGATIGAPPMSNMMPAPAAIPQQAIAPPQQQMAMAATQPAIPMGYGGYPAQALSVREPSFLSGPDIQGALKADFMERLKQGASDRRAARAEEIGTKIFGSTIAPALAIFGGPGTSDAGVQLIKEANQKVKEGRAEQQNRELAAFRGMQGIAEIVNTSSIKPMQTAFKAQNDFAKAAMQETGKNARFVAGEEGKNTRQSTRIEGQQNLEKTRQTGRTELEKLRHENRSKILETQLGEKKREFDLNYQQKEKFEDMAHSFGLLKEKNRLGLASAQEQQETLKMAQDLKKFAATREFEQLKFNAELEKSFRRKDKNGFQYQDENGQPLDPEQFRIEMNHEYFGAEPGNTQNQELMQGLDAYIQQYQESKGAPAKGGQQPQAGAAPSQSKHYQQVSKKRDPNELKQAVIQSLLNRGLSLEQARAKVQGM